MKNMAELSTARANTYGFLASVYHAEPSSSFLNNLKELEGSGVLDALNLSLADIFEGTPDEDDLKESLAIEFSRLFIGPGSHISPHESIHVTGEDIVDGELWGKATVAVKKFMAAAQVETDDKFGGMPDHISAEFEFMQQLAQQEAEAWAEKNGEIARNIWRVEKRFFEEHLSRWVDGFCDMVIENADNPFYSKFAQATKDFVEFETENLNELDNGLDAQSA